MRMLTAVCVLFVLVFAIAPLGRADEIRLGDGRKIFGDVVKETADSVFVDIGHTILAIPKKEITGRSKGDGSAEEAGVESTLDEDIFTRVNTKEMSVRDNVDRIGEGIVLVRRPGALGSGSIISRDGYVITNAHVVQGEQDITVTVFHKTKNEFEKKVFKKVEIIAVNQFMDLAVLKLDPEELGDFELTVVPFGDMEKLRIGEQVFAIGNPLGLDRTVSEGIVSITNRGLQGMTYIQTTAAINPGNSGGPLLNLKGEMVGVNSMSFIGGEGLHLAIPVHRVKEFIKNRDAFAYDKDNPNSGYHYLEPPTRGGPDT